MTQGLPSLPPPSDPNSPALVIIQIPWNRLWIAEEDVAPSPVSWNLPLSRGLMASSHTRVWSVQAFPLLNAPHKSCCPSAQYLPPKPKGRGYSLLPVGC